MISAEVATDSVKAVNRGTPASPFIDHLLRE
jgi:hypothetical protein